MGQKYDCVTSWLNLGVYMVLLLWKMVKELVIGGGFSDNNKAMSVKKGTCDDMVELFTDHEEADTRLLLRASHALRTFKRIVIQSTDTDVAVLCTAHFEKLLCEEMWFKTGERDELRFIPIHQVCHNFGKQCVQLYLGSMLSLGATLLVVSVERVKRDIGT